MDKGNDIKSIIVNRLLSRAKTGLYFLEECLIKIHKGGTDPAYSRSIYMLLSYNFELILKSKIILSKSARTKEELIKDLKYHNLEKLSQKLSSGQLNEINIKNIRAKKDTNFDEYIIEMIDGKEIVIQDLVDVRYDFEKDNLRAIYPNESIRISNEIKYFLKIIKKIESSIVQ